MTSHRSCNGVSQHRKDNRKYLESFFFFFFSGGRKTHLLLSTFITGPFHRLSLLFFAGLCVVDVVDAARRTLEPRSRNIALSGAVAVGKDSDCARRRVPDASHYRAGDRRSIIIIIPSVWLQNVPLPFSASDPARRSFERRQAVL